MTHDKDALVSDALADIEYVLDELLPKHSPVLVATKLTLLRDKLRAALTAMNTRDEELTDSAIQAAEEAYDACIREAGQRSPYLNTRAFRVAFHAALRSRHTMEGSGNE